MSKRTLFTTITPLPPSVSRKVVMETLYSHTEMIDLNPLVIERHLIKAPLKATAEEAFLEWYQITDKVSYLPGISGSVTSEACFHDLVDGIQTHIYAPLGLEIKGKWTLGGYLPGEPPIPVEAGLGIPQTGLYIREDCDIRCNRLFTSFVKKTTKKAHESLVGRLVVKSQLEAKHNGRITQLGGNIDPKSPMTSPQIARAHTSATPSSSSGGSSSLVPNNMTFPNPLDTRIPSPYLASGRMAYAHPAHDNRNSYMSGSSSGYPPTPNMQQSYAHDQQQQQQHQQPYNPNSYNPQQQHQQYQQYQQSQQYPQSQYQPSPQLQYQQSHQGAEFAPVEMSADTKTSGGPPSRPINAVELA